MCFLNPVWKMAIPWAFQYRRQFVWLRHTRTHLYRLISLQRRKVILEPGCSIALITEEIAHRSKATVVGLDSDLPALREARKRSGELNLVCADIHAPPFKAETFDAIIFQFFLLWLKEPLQALQTMESMLQDGGSLTAIAEPDYGGRVDFPDGVSPVPFIIERLRQEGADPFVGRKLDFLFRSAMLRNVSWGLASVPFGIERAREHFEMEWQFLETLSPGGAGKRLETMKTHEQDLLRRGKRSYFMPVFYCTAEKAKRY